MHLRETVRVIALSADHKHRLVELVAEGPEGGRSLNYQIQTHTGDVVIEMPISSTFRYNGGEKKEAISAEVCQKSLKALNAELKKHQFQGITLHPERCDQRTESITVYNSHLPSEAPGKSALISVTEAEFKRAQSQYPPKD